MVLLTSTSFGIYASVLFFYWHRAHAGHDMKNGKDATIKNSIIEKWIKNVTIRLSNYCWRYFFTRENGGTKNGLLIGNRYFFLRFKELELSDYPLFKHFNLYLLFFPRVSKHQLAPLLNENELIILFLSFQKSETKNIHTRIFFFFRFSAWTFSKVHIVHAATFSLFLSNCLLVSFDS